tara:strand:- start:5693 stop:5809 length:117 start_codon:yes stop_codon:yes gene_type:complete
MPEKLGLLNLKTISSAKTLCIPPITILRRITAMPVKAK